MRPRLLLPYAVVAIVIAIGSSAAVVATARPTSPATDASAAPSPSAAASRATPELSRTSHLAYWRDGKLWVSNLDGSVRYSIASVDDVRRVSLLRWSTDGGAVAFVDSGLALVVVTTSGERISVALPPELVTDRGGTGRYQIKDLRWSPTGDRIAATVLRPTDGRSDAYVVDLTAAPRSWTRVTTLEDLFVADWISDDELLGYTSGGAVVTVTAAEGGRIRLLTGSTGVSPIVAPDGRIHFLMGRVTARDPSFPFQTASRASVWSSATDGSDLRRETTWAIDDVRLDARLPDGRYLVHRGSSNALGTVTNDVVLLPSSAGVVERVRVTPDGRTAYGFTPDKIVRMDLTKLVVGPTAATSGSMTVFLDTSGEADVWFPSQLSLARGGDPVATAPAARYAFTLAGHTWQMEKGVATLLRAGPTLRRNAAASPLWSPSGDHLLLEETAAPAGAPLVAFVLDRDGKATQLSATLGAGRSYAWSPTGSELAIAVDRRGGATTGSPQWEIRFFDPTGRATRTAVPGTEVAWTRTGLFVLADAAGAAIQSIEKIDGDAPARTVTTAGKLLTDPQASPVGGRTGGLTGLDASPDGSFASARMQVQDPSGARSYIVVVGANGTAPAFARADDLTDVAWSPSSALLGYTVGVRTADEHAIVITPAGATVATQDGRFAGWSPDAKWYLVARTGTLYAYPVGGGSAVRLGPAAAPVSATPAR